MNDQDFERLSLFVDDALPPEEAAEVSRLVESDPEWKAAFRELRTTGELMRAPVDAAASKADFDRLWTGIEAGLPAPPRAPSLLDRLKAVFSPPVLIGLAAAAAAAVYVASRPASAPSPAPAPAPAVAVEVSEPVIIEGVENEGTKTVLVSQPVEATGTTVIWLLESPDAGTVEGSTAPTSDDDPI